MYWTGYTLQTYIFVAMKTSPGMWSHIFWYICIKASGEPLDNTTHFAKENLTRLRILPFSSAKIFYSSYKDQQVDINPVHEIIIVFCKVFEITNKCTGYNMHALPLCFKTLKNKHGRFVLHIVQFIIKVFLSWHSVTVDKIKCCWIHEELLNRAG
jgi:hypothetical protein